VDYDFHGSDRFDVVARLGEGSMGVVYRALDRERNETVAIKTLRNLDGDRLLRFKNEFRSIQSLQHPNLVSLGELIEAHGAWFFTMELVEGIDFYSYVRPRWPRPSDDDLGEETELDFDPAQPRATFDEERLRAALAQLAHGVAMLHQAGFVHRDIKPSNVLVSRNGRVVLLDFGFVAGAHERSTDRVVGTIAYMSPEQAASIPVGPASDWYSVGVVLYEALTGRPPFDGMPLEVLMAKQFRTPIRPSDLIHGIPTDLDDLCMELLRTSPAERPSGRDVLLRLGAEVTAPISVTSSVSLPHHLFVGRAAELGALREAYGRSRAGETVAVTVQGESGIGKTALVRAFTDELAEAQREALVLRSTCYERESVPFKAFDGVADSLSEYLVQLPAVEATGLVPLHVTHVAEVFPVLRRSAVIGKAVRPQAGEVEPAELRARVFAGLRELFTRLSARRPLVLVIDDFQWADADSVALLRELVRPPDPPPMLLITTVRDGHETPARLASPAQAIGATSPVQLRLGGLDDSEARDMVRRLALVMAPGLESEIDAIVEESRGHPLYIDEIVRFGGLEGADPGGALHLEDVLWSRVLMLDRPAREIVELVAVASSPLVKGMAAAILRHRFSDFVRWVGHLRLIKLVQTTGMRKGDKIELYHDRVRRAVLAHMGAGERRMYHERLALAFEGAPGAAPELLAIHWEGAGDVEKAFHYTRNAALQAERALAFDRAARLHRRCLDLLPPYSRDGTAIRTRLGDALVNAGRGSEAANAYLAAARDAREGVVELHAKAAGQLLRSGHVDSSIEVLRRALEGLDLTLPETARGAVLSLLRQRAMIRLSGLGFKPRQEAEISERDLTRVDVSWALAVGFGLIDVIRGAEFQAKHLRLALAIGEPGRVARALSVEVAYRYVPGTRGRGAERVLQQAVQLTAQLGNPPNLVGINTLMAGIGGVCMGDWHAAEENCRRAEEVLAGQCSGVAWELASARIMGLWALWYLGDVKEMVRRLPGILRAAQERGDLYAFTTCRTYFTPIEHLVRDELDHALEEGEQSLRRWSQRGFHFQHYFHLFATTQVRLYGGDAEAAHRGVEEAWPALKSSLLLSVQQNRVEALHFRGRAELALGRARSDAALIERAGGRARAIARERTIWGEGLASLLRAGVERAGGRDEAAAETLRHAIASLDRAGMQLYAEAARRGLGATIGDDRLVRQADAAMAQLGVINPARMAAMLVPGV
jgi:tetratricopeptide (TPR) repeat protein